MLAGICAALRNSWALQLWGGLWSLFKTWRLDAGAQKGGEVHAEGWWQQGPEGCEWRNIHSVTLWAEGLLLGVPVPVSCCGLWGWCCSMSSSISLVTSEQGCPGSLVTSRAEDLFSSSAARASLFTYQVFEVQRCLLSWTVPFYLRSWELGKEFRFIGGKKDVCRCPHKCTHFFHCTLCSCAWELPSLFLTIFAS